VLAHRKPLSGPGPAGGLVRLDRARAVPGSTPRTRVRTGAVCGHVRRARPRRRSAQQRAHGPGRTGRRSRPPARRGLTTMANRSSSLPRAERIDRLRARPAIERESLAHDIASASRSLQPRNLVKRWLPGLSGGNLSGLVWQGVALARRYPFISSTVSALIMG